MPARSLTNWARKVGPDTWLGVIVLAFSLLVRLGSLRPVNNPDAVYKWEAARALVAGTPLSAHEFDHHAARWGITLPTALLQVVFGDRAWVYFVPILGAMTLLAFLTYRLGAAVGGRWAGALAVVLYTPLPALNYVGSQLMPEMIQSTFVMGCLLALVRLNGPGGERQPWIAGVWFFVAYLAKESVVLFLPGLLLASWLVRRRLWDTARFGATFASGVLLETALYGLTYGFPLGRLSVVLRHHLGNAKMRPPIESVSDLLVRYLDLQTGFRELFYGGLAASLALVLWPKARRRLDERRLFAVLATCWGFFLCSTFAVKSLDPPRLVQPLNERYLFAGIPFLAVLVVAICRALVPPLVRERFQSRTIASFAVACAVAGSGLWLLRSPPGEEHAIATMNRSQSELRSAFDRGVPIVNPERKRHATGAVLGLFLSAEQSRHAKVLYPKQSGKQARVIIDQRHRRYRGLGKRKQTRILTAWKQEPHVLVRMQRGFIAQTRSKRAGGNETASTR